MTVSELIEHLKDLPQDMDVMIDLTDYSEHSETTMFKFHGVNFIGPVEDSTGSQFVIISPWNHEESNTIEE